MRYELHLKTTDKGIEDKLLFIEFDTHDINAIGEFFDKFREGFNSLDYEIKIDPSSAFFGAR